ncbi:MAG: type II 3-dehydroquinate dehydratase [Clostridiaceae bacterium]|nr:type II 3-dehydroquinate dehydratase [Clostridiaceae bacterium]
MLKIRVINGPNLNMLGVREPEIYGKQTLNDIEDLLRIEAQALDIQLDFFQSNHEGEIIDSIHGAYMENFDGLIINPGAYTHYSYAIRDAVSSVKIPCIEVHLSNIYVRDEFRKNSVVAPVCTGQISGFGSDSYIAALYVLYRRLNKKS